MGTELEFTDLTYSCSLNMKSLTSVTARVKMFITLLEESQGIAAQ